jgi:predicted TIM-barrel enzyme
LAGCNFSALAVAHTCSLQFIRAEAFVFSHVADEGIMNASAGKLLRYKKNKSL